MVAYYNEIDPNAAEWLRQLIEMGAIAPGDVDGRSIEDVSPVDLEPYTQCHFFAGIGAWSYALRQSGWPDNKPVWTGSCPCQPFSAAGKGAGLADERHLWPAMFWLIQQCRPPIVLGEQVASKDGLGWWDIVASDLESQNYACAAIDLCAAGLPSTSKVPVEFIDEATGEAFTVEVSDVPFGAPHLRQRLFWVANSSSKGLSLRGLPWLNSMEPKGATGMVIRSKRCGSSSAMADAYGQRGQQDTGIASSYEAADGGKGWDGCESKSCYQLAGDGKNSSIVLVNTNSERREKRCISVTNEAQQLSAQLPSFYSDAIWIPCLDGKARPAKPGAFPLVNGPAPDLVRGGDSRIQTEETSEARVMRIKGYGNAIVAPLAVVFVEAVQSVLEGLRDDS